jgi:hypothetical protein
MIDSNGTGERRRGRPPGSGLFYGTSTEHQTIYYPPELLRVVEDMADAINREQRLRGNKRMTFSKLMVKWALEKTGLSEKYGQGE